jgi:DNA-binding winged helix-turn-helix (wHTH) protein
MSRCVTDHLFSSRFSLGEWQIDAATNSMCRAHERRRIEPKQMRVLLSLAAADGMVRTRWDLLDDVWPQRYVVDGTLKRAVSELRKALGDDARHPRYIETVYKVGYRLVMPPAMSEVADPR